MLAGRCTHTGRCAGFAVGALLAMSAPAHAQQFEPEYDKFYASVSAGLSDVSDRYAGIDYGDTPWNLQAVAGYRFDWAWSAELALQTYGDVEALNVPGSGVDRLDFASSLDSASFRVRLWFPASELLDMRRPVVVFGFAGIHASNIERQVTNLQSMSTLAFDETDSGLNLGAGVVIGLGRFNLRGSIERLDFESSDASIVSTTIGLEFAF